MAKSEAETKKLVPEKFYRWIKVFGKKQSERMPTQKIWNHAIDMKDVKNEGSGLNIFLFSSLIFILFLIYFPLFYF